MPPREPSAYVWDIRRACRVIRDAITGISLDDYLKDEIRRLAMGRLLITVGEALGRLSKTDPAMASELGNVAQIVAFRNRLVHGYFQIDHAQVWETLQTDLAPLLAAAERVWSRYAPLYPDAEDDDA